jgi:hypothetical protein
MSSAEQNNNSCVRFSSGVNIKFENCFDKVGTCLFRCPVPILLITLIFNAVCCIFISQIDTAEDILELLLGEDSIVLKVTDWRDKHISSSNWGRCLTYAPTTSPTSPCIDDPNGYVAGQDTSCSILKNGYGCEFDLSDLVGFPVTVKQLCHVTCEYECGASVRRRREVEFSRRLDCSFNSWEDSTYKGSSGSLVILAVDHDAEDVLKPQYLLSYLEILKRFLIDWNTTCDAYPNLEFGFKDVAIWDLMIYDESYMAVADFPLDNTGILRCFREGNWAYFNNTGKKVLEDIPMLADEFNILKPSLKDIYNSGLSSSEQEELVKAAIHRCWLYYPVKAAAFPYTSVLGGAEFREFTSDDMPQVGDHVLAYVGVNDYSSGIIGNIDGSEYDVLDAPSGTEPLIADHVFNIDELLHRVSKAVGIQTIFDVTIFEEFAKRVQRHHYQYCETLNGTYDCSNDSHWDEILDSAEVCHRKIIDDLADAIRAANDAEDLLIDVSIFTPFDEANVLEHAATTNEGMLLICLCIMIVFIAIIAANPCNPRQSKALVGSIGVVLMYFSTMAGIGLCKIIFQAEFTPSTLQALPFMGLGLGVDDMLVLLWTYRYEASKLQIGGEISRSIREAGLSITLTSVTNFVAFVIGAHMPLKELSYFSQTAACVMFTNYITILFGFSTILIIHNALSVARRDSIIEKIGPQTLIFDDEGAAKENLGYKTVKEFSEKALGVLPSLCILIISISIFGVALLFSPNPE